MSHKRHNRKERRDSSRQSDATKPMTADYYAVLGVPENASSQQIKAAFRRIALEHHPDKQAPSTAAASSSSSLSSSSPSSSSSSSSQRRRFNRSEEVFKRANEAYAVLGDEDKRREYDNARKQGEEYNFSQRDNLASDEAAAEELLEACLQHLSEQGGTRGRMVSWTLRNLRPLCLALSVVGAALTTAVLTWLGIVDGVVWLVYFVGTCLGAVIYYVLYAAAYIGTFVGGLIVSQNVVRWAAQRILALVIARVMM